MLALWSQGTPSFSVSHMCTWEYHLSHLLPRRFPMETLSPWGGVGDSWVQVDATRLPASCCLTLLGLAWDFPRLKTKFPQAFIGDFSRLTPTAWKEKAREKEVKAERFIFENVVWQLAGSLLLQRELWPSLCFVLGSHGQGLSKQSHTQYPNAKRTESLACCKWNHWEFLGESITALCG